jgi:uncharacterized protein YcnI
MKRNLCLTVLALTVPSLAMAHVSVRPRESRPGAEERYTVRVPTEGTVATTHVQLEIPPDVVVLEVMPADGATFEMALRRGLDVPRSEHSRPTNPGAVQGDHVEPTG